MTGDFHPEDTIAALASAPGPAARAIVRVSGTRVSVLIDGLFVPSPDSVGAHRGPWCQPGTIRLPALARPIPADLYLWPGRRTYTGEPLAEWHMPGSPPLVEALLAELFARGVRPAQPGEFTLRAFLAGRIDLTQAEAVLGVIDARTAGELQTALAQLAGGLSGQIVRLRGDLLDLLADLEAGLDFADEALEFVSHVTLVGRLGLAREALARLLEQTANRMHSAVRPRVVLAGLPNAGKSTLFNTLIGHSAALVSNLSGTTRDYLEAPVTWNDQTITLVDTAGRDQEATGIAAEAQRLRDEQVQRADLVVWCHATTTGEMAVAMSRQSDWLLVLTKLDLLTDGGAAARSGALAGEQVAVSARTGAGLDALKNAILSRLSDPAASSRQFLGSTAARAQDSLTGAMAALERALTIARREADQELLAIEIRECLESLGTISGAVYTDDILDRIFGRFCIGK